MKLLRNQRGFTLLEMTISTVMFSVLIVVISGMVSIGITNFVQGDAYNQAQNEANVILNDIVSNIHRGSSAINACSNYNDAHRTDCSFALSGFTVDIPALDSSGNVLYTDNTHRTICTNEVVYFGYIGTGTGGPLYRRSIESSGSPSSCTATNATVNSCQPGGGCSATDSTLARNFYALTVTDCAGNASLTNKTCLKLVLTIKKKVSGRTITLSYTSYATLNSKGTV